MTPVFCKASNFFRAVYFTVFVVALLTACVGADKPQRPVHIQTTQASPSDQPSAQPFLWGAVGHNNRPQFGSSYAYNRISLDAQMRLLRGAELTALRTSCGRYRCSNLVDQASASGVTLLTVLELKPDERLGEKDNYQTGFDFAVRTVRAYGGGAHYIEAGNEIDNWVGINGDGSTRANYNQARYKQARGLIKGMIDGVHSVDAKASVMVNDAGWCHYGFLHSLWDDGVRWDITAFHWYSNQGNIEKAGCQSANVAQFHAAFGLPVWITEFNSSESAKNDDQEGAAKWLVAFIDQLRLVAEKYNIRAAFIYELLDEPNLTGMESHFGLADGAGNPKAAYKAVASKLLFK